MSTVVSVASTEQAIEAVCSLPRLVVRGGDSKGPLSRPAGEPTVRSTTGLAGIVEYDPQELTVTARAGTPIQDLALALRERGQFLPFDPLLADDGATVGGTIAANANGPGRLRYGGVRDFLIGVRFVDGHGTLLRGGGKVVKNAAGFDFPKLMVGSLGRLGLLTEATFKVFPRPQATATVHAETTSLVSALRLRDALALRPPVELSACDIEIGPAGKSHAMTLRVRGDVSALEERLLALERVLTDHHLTARRFTDDEDKHAWCAVSALNQPSLATHHGVVRAALPAGALERLESALTQTDWAFARRYVARGAAAWLEVDQASSETLHQILVEQGIPAIAGWGPLQRRLWGSRDDATGVSSSRHFSSRVIAALDPAGRFAPADESLAAAK